ncbi:MAG TPA: TlpA disulfide reductase family protein [Vicinamibacterales bacterium]|jgi:cytochrome c biogenesis protein CcmG/thiol:disulfide interchange protein DsbE
MKMRWVVVAALGVLVLALLTPLPERMIEWFSDGTSAEAAGGGCSVSATPANLAFTLKDMNGKDVKLSDFKGKVVLLNFWATWCPPCKMEIPWFVALQEKYKSKGFQAIGVSVDDTPDKLPPFAQQFKINYPLLVGLDREDIQNAYGPIFAVPVTVIIGRDGKICVKHLGPVSREQFESEIKALL